MTAETLTNLRELIGDLRVELHDQQRQSAESLRRAASLKAELLAEKRARADETDALRREVAAAKDRARRAEGREATALRKCDRLQEKVNRMRQLIIACGGYTRSARAGGAG